MTSFSQTNYALLRGLLVGAVVLASASACSRPDRTETGTNNTGNGAMVADTANSQDQSNAVMPPAGDTASAANADTNRATGTANAPRAETANPTPESASRPDTSAAGYREMDGDTSTAEMAAPRDSARVTADSTMAPGEQSSVPPSDSAPMEVATPTTDDTSAAAPQGETPEAAAVPADSSVEMAGAAVQDWVADSATGYSEMRHDTSTTMASDTSASAVDTAVASSDTTVGVGDSANVARTGDRLDPVAASAEANDTLTRSEGTPVRPPEDSTEVYGNRTDNAAPDEVGAAAIGGNVNGADAVALMTRQGVQCIVVDAESAQGDEVDMSDTPTTLNPCGLGSMVPTRIGTQQE